MGACDWGSLTLAVMELREHGLYGVWGCGCSAGHSGQACNQVLGQGCVASWM